MKKIVGILPVAIYRGKLYFLFGKENTKECKEKGFSDFGGGADPGESRFQTAVRECSEETMGFLGSPAEIRRYIKNNGGTYSFTLPGDSGYSNTVYIIQYPYDASLPDYYKKNHTFLWKRMNQNMLAKTKLFEKKQIEWFCETDLENRISEFRPFYRRIVQAILERKREIKEFVKNCTKKSRRVHRRVRPNGTRKVQGG